MSVLQFVEMDVITCVICSIISLVICLTYSGIGYLFSAKKGIVFQSVLGMTFVGAIGAVCAAFFAATYKYLIIIFAIIGAIILCHRIWKKNIQIKEIFVSLIPVSIIFAIAFINLMYFVFPENGIFHYNCHETYFSGVSLEIFKADYFSRIRLIDVYPFEWSKYHFFNGTYIAIPLLGFIKKNYISYLLAKMMQVAFYGGCMFEAFSQKYNKKKAVMILGVGMTAFFVCQFNGFVWSIATNNFSCLFMMLLAWLAFEEGNYSDSIMLSIGYAITKSGSIISGGLLFVFGLYKLYFNDRKSVVSFVKSNYRTAIYALTVGIGILSMVLTGKDNVNGSSLIFSLTIGWIKQLIGNMFNLPWFGSVPLGGALSGSSMYPLRFEFLIIGVYLLLIAKNMNNLKLLLKKYKYTVGIFVVLSMILLVGGILLFENAEIALQIYLLRYLLPIITLFSCLSEKMLSVFWVYLLSLLLNFILFNAEITGANYCIITLIILTIFAEQFVINVCDTSVLAHRLGIYVVSILCIIYIVGSASQSMFFMNPLDYYHEELVLTDVPYSNDPYEYYSEEDAYLAKLNALKGNRVHYNVLPTRKDKTMHDLSMAMSFLSLGYEAEFYNQP